MLIYRFVWDDEMYLLNTYGEAREYKVYGETEIEITWSKGERVTSDDLRRKLIAPTPDADPHPGPPPPSLP